MKTYTLQQILFISCALAGGMAHGENSLPDIQSSNGLVIGGAIGGAGGKSVAWGGSVALKQADAFLTSNGKCAFNVMYDLENAGTVATPNAFKNMWYAGTTAVSINSALTLAAGQSRQVMTQMYLTPGSYDLTLKLDSDGSVTESNEQNNVRSIHVTLDATCGANPPPPPPPPARADLVSQKGLQIGGANMKSVAWGASVIVHASDALMMAGGHCAFNLGYDIENTGNAAAAGFTNRIYAGKTLVSQQSALSVAAQATRNVATQAYLSPGINTIYLVLDANNDIAESNEGNNITSVTVNVDSTCVASGVSGGSSGGSGNSDGSQRK